MLILFDLDGTIINTNELIIQSFLHTFEGITEQPVTRDHIITNMGRPLLEQMKFFSGRESVGDLVHKYRAFNMEKHNELVTEFPGVRETLGKLHAAGIKMGIVTSKVRITSEMGLKLCGLYDYFDTIVTVEDVKSPKPDPEGIRKALRELGSDANGSIMVGDSHYDIEAAQNAGIPAVAVAWSLKGIPYLKQYQPTHIIYDIKELLNIAGIEERFIETNG